MQWPIICDLTRTNHRTPSILPRFRGVVTKNTPSNLETSHRKRGTPHKWPAAIILAIVWPIVMRINYDVKARGKTIGTLHRPVFCSESVSHTDPIIGLVWMHLKAMVRPFGSWVQLSVVPVTHSEYDVLARLPVFIAPEQVSGSGCHIE